MLSRVAIPNIPLAGDAATRHFYTAIKIAIESRLNAAQSSPDRYVTVRELAESGVAEVDRTGQIANSGNTGEGDSGNTFSTASPPAPEAVMLSATWNNVFITWSTEIPENAAYLEVYRADGAGAVLADAYPQGTGTGYIYVDAGIEQDKTYRYWVRWVNYHNIPGPWHDPAGTEIYIDLDPAELLKRLQAQIGDSHLAVELLNKINFSDTEVVRLDGEVTRVDGELAQAAADLVVVSDTLDTEVARIDAHVDIEVARLDTDVAQVDLTHTLAGQGRDGIDNLLTQRVLEVEDRINVTGHGRSLEQVSDRLETISTTMDGYYEGYVTLTTSTLERLDVVETQVDENTGGGVANAAAITELDARVTTNETDVSTNATDIVNTYSHADAAHGKADSNATAITALDARVTSTESDVVGQSSAISSLQSDVTQNQSDITAHSSDITALQADVTTNAGDISGQGTALSALDTRVTSAEGTITSHSTDISVLDARVDNHDSDIAARVSAYNGLESRVTVAENDVDANASDIAQLDVRVTTAEGDITGTSTALSALTTRVTNTENETTSNAQDVTALDVRVTAAEGDITTQASAATALTTRVTNTENATTSNASDITNLDTRVTTAEGDITAQASAASALTTRVTNTENATTTNASDITALDTRVTSTEGDVTANASAITALDTRTTTAEGTITAHSSDITSLQASLDNIGGAGVNILVPPYSDFEDAGVTVTGTTTNVRDVVTSYFGSASMKTTASANNQYIRLSDLATNYNVFVKPSSKWIVSAYVRSSKASATGQFRIKVAGGAEVSATGSFTTSATANTWTRVEQLVDLSAHTDDTVHLLVYHTGWASGLEDMFIDAVMIEEQIGNSTEASAYRAPFTDITESTAFTDLEARVTVNEGDITTSASDITALDSRLTTAESDIDAETTARTALTTRVTNTENETTTNASDITALDGRLTTAEGDIDAETSARTALTTRVTNTENATTANSNSITSLDTRLTTAEGDIDAETSARNALTTRVTNTENATTANSSSITSLDSRLTTAESDIDAETSARNALTARVTATESDTTVNASDISALDTRLTTAEGDTTANGSAINSLNVRVTATESDISGNTASISSNASAITQLQSDVDAAEADISGQATALSGLTTRVTTAENDINTNETAISATAADVTALESRVTSTENNTAGNASATSALTTRVSNAENDIVNNDSAQTAATNALSNSLTATATDVTNLTTRVDTAETNITGNATATSALTTRVDNVEGEIAATASSVDALKAYADRRGNELDPERVWQKGTQGSQTLSGYVGFNRNGDLAENDIVIAEDHTGVPSKMWRCTASGNGGPDGGWNSTNFTIDPARGYRFSVFAKKSSNDGSFYMGCLANTVRSTPTENINSNPYFWSGDFPDDEWYLVVGYVLPYDAPTAIYDLGAVYNMAGQRVAETTEFRWNDATVTATNHRAYLYYADVAGTQQWLHAPRVDKIDGNEPSVEELISSAGRATAEVVQQLDARVALNESGLAHVDAQYTLKLNADGHIAGFGLASSNVAYSPGVHSQAVFAVDRFLIVDPDDNSVQFGVENGKIVFPGQNIGSGTIGNAQIGNAAVDTAQIATAAVQTANIDNAAITNAKILNSAVTNAKIQNAAITTAKIADAQITTAKIKDAAVETLTIKDHAVTVPQSWITEERQVVSGWNHAGDSGMLHYHRPGTPEYQGPPEWAKLWAEGTIDLTDTNGAMMMTMIQLFTEVYYSGNRHYTSFFIDGKEIYSGDIGQRDKYGIGFGTHQNFQIMQPSSETVTWQWYGWHWRTYHGRGYMAINPNSSVGVWTAKR